VHLPKRLHPLLLISLVLPFGAVQGGEVTAAHPGAVIYQKLCVDCHGPQGEGVAAEYNEPLTGERSLAALTKRIARTMPEDDPGVLVGDDAAQVAAYIYEAFYSPAAQARRNPPEIDLARLTAPQFRTTIADLVGSFRGGFQAPAKGEHGLKARYSARPRDAKPEEEKTGEVKKKEDVRFERVDKQVALAFGSESPDPATMSAEQFSVRWEGSVLAEETGVYEFVLKTENGARLRLNDQKKLLIDGWVTAGSEVREEKKSVFLLGGRAYPLSLEFFKYKDKTASIELQWKPPHGVLETIPERHLIPQQVRPTLVVSTAFPADDRSVGYERGTGVSKDWHQATIVAAVAVADHVEENLAELSGVKPEAPDRIPRLRDFARRFVETAFRRPLTEEQQCFVESQFGFAKSPEIAIKRVVLFALKSPHFLYPELHERAEPDGYDVATRLALSMWDSLPDEALLRAAGEGKLQTREGVATEANRMLRDPRTRAKLNGFFHHWLDLERAESISKDPQAFPGFDEAVLADLRTSLALFIDQVVWSERADFRELLQADYLLLNERLAKFYGKGEVGPGFQRVAFDPKERAGVVTHPYLMSALAHNKLTSPIHRGVFLTRNVLGITLKSPPNAVEFEDSKFDPSFTMREKVTELTRDTSCMGCHSVINPLGFTLEQYDAIGRWRTEDNHKPVDAGGELPMDDGEIVRLTGARDVADLAARSEDAQRAFVRQLFHHTVKQDAAAFGPNTLDALRRSFSASEFNIQKLLTEITIISATKDLPTPDPQLARK
jgi:hypothetical protein